MASWSNSIMVPANRKERAEWFKTFRIFSITTFTRESLVKWYGKKKGNTITPAESFEIYEYDNQPTEEEIRELFSMLK